MKDTESNKYWKCQTTLTNNITLIARRITDIIYLEHTVVIRKDIYVLFYQVAHKVTVCTLLVNWLFIVNNR